MKSQVAAEVAAAAALGDEGWRPRRGELLVITTADEEMGAAAGAQWLCREHPDKVRCDYVLNEGGGLSFELGGRRFYTLCVGEKGVCRFKLRARGKAGHASVPALGDNALLKLAPALERLSRRPPLEATPEAVEFLETLADTELDAEDPNGLAAALDRLRARAPEVAAYLAEPMLHVTLVPTLASASRSVNVVPSRAEVTVDCRVSPGIGKAEALARARAALGDAAEELDLVPTEAVTGNRSPSRSPLAEMIEAWLSQSDPGATLVPIVMAGFSDSNWFRKAFDSAVIYGFCPQREMSLREATPLFHNADERAAAADIGLATRFYRDIVLAALG
jgi:acetylornithine deacetylase/succinyl-diaminopimelate desuccinylase-like protein